MYTYRLFPAKFSVAAKGLIIGMLHPDPSVRVNVQEAQKHPWCINSNRNVCEVCDVLITFVNTLNIDDVIVSFTLFFSIYPLRPYVILYQRTV